MAEMSGRRAVEMVLGGLRPVANHDPRKRFENAITVDMAIGGSTNAVVHLIAIAGRLGIELALDEFDTISRRTPYIANVKPSGEFLMEDFFYAGGLPAVMREILHLLHGDALTVTGKTIGENVSERRMLSPRGDPHRRRSAASRGRHGDSLWEPGSRRRGDQADGRVAASAAASRAARTCSRTIEQMRDAD